MTQLTPTPREQIEALLERIGGCELPPPHRDQLYPYDMRDQLQREGDTKRHLGALADEALMILRKQTKDGSRRPMKDAPRDGTLISAGVRKDAGIGADLNGRNAIIRYLGPNTDKWQCLFQHENGPRLLPESVFAGWLPIPEILA